MEAHEIEALIEAKLEKVLNGLRSEANAVKGTVTVLERPSFWHSWQLKAFIGVVLFLGVVGLVYEFGQYDKAIVIAQIKEDNAKNLAKIAEDTNKATEQMRSTFFEELSKTQEQLKAATNKQLAISKKITTRNTDADTRIATVIAPDRKVEDIKKDVETNLQLSPDIVNNSLVFTPTQVQAIVALKLNEDRLEANLKDVNEQLLLEQEKTKKLTEQLQLAIDNLNQSAKSISDLSSALKASNEAMLAYKTAAKKTKWQIFKSVAIRVAEIAVVGVVAYAGGAAAH